MLCPRHQKRIKRVCLTCHNFIVCEECLDEGSHSRHHTEMWGKVQKELLEACDQAREKIKSQSIRLKRVMHKRSQELRKLFQRMTQILEADLEQWISNILKDQKENLAKKLKQGSIDSQEWEQLKALQSAETIETNHEPRINYTFDQLTQQISKIMNQAQLNPQNRQSKSYSKASNERFFRSSSAKSSQVVNPRRKLSKGTNNSTIKKSPSLFKPEYFSFIQSKFKKKEEDILGKISKNKDDALSRDSLMQQLIQEKRMKERLESENIRSIIKEQLRAVVIERQPSLREQQPVDRQAIQVEKENQRPRESERQQKQGLQQLPVESRQATATIIEESQSVQILEQITLNKRHHTSIMVSKPTTSINAEKSKVPRRSRNVLNTTINQVDQSAEEQQQLKNKLSLIPRTTEFLEQNLPEMEQLWRPYDLMCWTRFFELRVQNNIDDGSYLQQRKKCKGKAFDREKMLQTLRSNIKTIKSKTIRVKTKNFLIVRYLLLLTLQIKLLSEPTKYSREEEEKWLGALQEERLQQIYRYMETCVTV